jgi:hypothetical protein
MRAASSILSIYSLGLPLVTMSMALISGKRLRTWIEGLAPYQSLALLALPVCLIEPMKLLAVAVAGEGHWIAGTLTVVVAYAGSLLLVERLFVIVKPKLLKLRWFAKIWARIVVCRYFLMSSLRNPAGELRFFVPRRREQYRRSDSRARISEKV